MIFFSRFKLRAHNEMGASAYSSDVSYTTDPGRPGPPPKPTLKVPYSFTHPFTNLFIYPHPHMQFTTDPRPNLPSSYPLIQTCIHSHQHIQSAYSFDVS